MAAEKRTNPCEFKFKPGDGASLRGRRLYLQNLGQVRARWYRELPEPHAGSAIGIDVGLHHALALSDGTLQRASDFRIDCYRPVNDGSGEI